ncbi:MAG: alpha-galactosidase [Bacillota bacterium]
MEAIIFSSSPGIRISFIKDKDQLLLESLFGLLCAGGNGPSHNQAPALLRIDAHRFASMDFKASKVDWDDRNLRVIWEIVESKMQLMTEWEFFPDFAVLKRKDTLVNTGRSPISIYGYLSRLALQPGNYELYGQSSPWGAENNGCWIPLHTGTVELGCVGGRTSQGVTPYACIREKQYNRGLAVHIIPCGNWKMRFTSYPATQGQAALAIESGMADDHLQMSLKPGQTWQSPEIFFQPLVEGRPETAAPSLHQWSNRYWFGQAKKEAPVVYNTWLDQFDNLELPRLRSQLSAARELGCEIFVIDAGWFGKGGGQWFEETGDWQESVDTAFYGRMKEFAEEVRGAGLGFGLWMEPEHFGPSAPIRKAHPGWFLGSRENGPRLDLENGEAYAYLESEIRRLIETYRLAWIKIDFNIELGYDERGWELNGYYQAWYKLLDELRRRYPETFFEGCASGGMRLDFNSLRHFDGQFLSDTTNTLDVIRIYEGALLRLPPGRLCKWIVLRSIGRTIPDYPGTAAGAPESLAIPTAAGWQPVQLAETVDLDLASLAVMPGMPGLSGDLAGLSAEARARLKKHLAFYKEWRPFIVGSHAYLLTSPRPIDDRSGWSVLQLCHSGSGDSLVFAYRLQDACAHRSFRLQGLKGDTVYKVTVYPEDAGGGALSMEGRALMSAGLKMKIDRPGQARVYILKG